MLRARLLLFVVVLGSIGIENYAFAHESRPGHMQLIEVDEGWSGYKVIWKEQIQLNTTVRLDPVFAADCIMTNVAPAKVGNDALIYH